MSNRPISVVELERRRLEALLSKDLKVITAMVEFNASKTKYWALLNIRCPSEHLVLMNNQALPRTAGKKLRYLFRARKYFSPSNLLTLYKAQIIPSLEYCSHIWGAAAPTTLSILDAVQRRAIRLICDPALTCHLQPLTSINSPLSKPARCTLGTSSSHHRAVVLHTSRTGRYNRTSVLRVSRAWNGLPGDVLVSLRMLAYSSPASANFP
nr:unnamed protein product [Callosobruchus chinensis]